MAYCTKVDYSICCNMNIHISSNPGADINVECLRSGTSGRPGGGKTTWQRHLLVDAFLPYFFQFYTVRVEAPSNLHLSCLERPISLLFGGTLSHISFLAPDCERRGKRRGEYLLTPW